MDRKWQSFHEATEFADYSILTLPKEAVPKGWAIRLGGVPMHPPVPTGIATEDEIFRRRQSTRYD
jgi:hypothetical protein